MDTPLPPWPPSFEVEHGPGHLVVRWRWRSEQSGRWLVAALSVLGVLLGLLSFDVGPFLPLDGPQMRPAGIAVLLCLLYVTLASLLNHTEVSVKQGVLEVIHRPLPWWPRRVLACDDVAQLFCREALEHDDRDQLISESYSVHLELRNGRTLRLTGGLWHPEQATWIEDAIEGLLGIEDKAVAGERFKARGLSRYR